MTHRIKAAGLACLLSGLLILLACPALASAFAPYQYPPRVPEANSAHVRALLHGSRLTTSQGWIVLHLSGGPYRVGFQNGFLVAQSTHYSVLDCIGAVGSHYRRNSEQIAKIVWSKVPREYQLEMRGIADGLHAAGYHSDTLWDVVAANDWADQDCYSALLRGGSAKTLPKRTARLPKGLKKGGCSAFIASGTATSDGRPVMGHSSWSWYPDSFINNVIFYVHPAHGFDFSYQSSGGQIWSGEDWYENSAGLLLTETTLADTHYNRNGTPIFVRARTAAQYDSTVKQCVHTLLKNNNGAYSNEWLIGDSTGLIASLQLGGRAHDLHESRNGFYGSSNFDWGTATRKEEGSIADPYNPACVDYARYLRWGQLKTQYHGTIDAAVGRTMEADTYDSFLGKILPDARTICGEPEHTTPGLLHWDKWTLSPCGATDAKICTEDMALHGQKMWARWGHASGDAFHAGVFLKHYPTWAADNGGFAVFGLRTFASQTPRQWTLVTRP
jgi:hypothetical protein